MNWLIGTTGYSFLDIWTFPHLGFWIFIGSGLWALKVYRTVALAYCIIAAFGWELFEKFAEYKWPDIWLNPESWWNSLLSDPLTCLIGILGMYVALDHWGYRIPKP